MRPTRLHARAHPGPGVAAGLKPARHGQEFVRPSRSIRSRTSTLTWWMWILAQALLAVGVSRGKPVIRSRMAIGALEGQTRLERRTIKVCSSAYCPLMHEWLAVSVKTIQVEFGGK